MNEKIHVVCPHCHKTNKIPNKTLTKANCGSCKNSLLSTNPIDLNEDSFNKQVANNDIPVLIDFWAEWCGPCKMMAPAFKEAAKEFAGKARFAKINTETEQMLAGKFRIQSIPTLILFKGNKEIERRSGAMQKEQIIQWVKAHTI